MNRGKGWWGTGPLVVGASGLLLMAFGAAGLPDSAEINAAAHQEAAKLQEELHSALSQQDVAVVLRNAEMEAGPGEEGKPAVNLRSLAPRNEAESDPGWIARAGDAYYQARSDHREPRGVLAGRIAFYGGLILVFAAGVLLYRRTPNSVYKAW